MSKFIIEPHFRLQEWVAEEKGYFRAEGQTKTTWIADLTNVLA